MVLLNNKMLPRDLIGIVVILNTLFNVNAGCETSTNSESGIALADSVFYAFTSSDVWGCFQACKNEPVCQSYNYNLETKLCEFNKETKARQPSRMVHRYLSVYMENPKRGKVGSSPGLAAHSCKNIRDLAGESRGTGEYWIDPAGTQQPLRVYCDMETVGGGWTLVNQIKLANTSPSSSSRIDTNDYRAIANYTNGRVIVKVPAIRELRRVMGFSQLRWRCRKQNVGRTIDIMTTNDSAGANVLKHFLDKASFPPACNSYVRLPDDDSILTQNCNNWGNTGSATKVNKWGRYSNNGDWRIYNNAIVWESQYYFTGVAPNFFCDDFTGGTYKALALGDTWQLFVR